MTETIEGVNYPDIKQSWGIVGTAILATLVFSPVYILLKDVWGKELSFLLYYILSMGATFGLIHRRRKIRTGTGSYNFDVSSAKIMILIAIAIIALQIGISVPIISLIPLPESVRKAFEDMAGQKGVISFITLVIAAPILEELIFRGIILNGLLKRYSPIKSILVSGLLFGFVHLNPWQFVSAMVLGTFSGWIYYKTNKLTLSILIHVVNNFAVIASGWFSDTDTGVDKPLADQFGGILSMVLVIQGAVLVAVICIYLLKLEFEKIPR